MADVTVVQTAEPVYRMVLRLTHLEADCLKAMVQNPIREDELSIEKNLREAIFNELHKVV